jgi:cell wall-associated NlpC family hydrolase
MADRKQVVEEARKIVNSGKYTYGQSRAPGYLDDAIMDCSEFVYQAYKKAGFLAFPELNSHYMAATFQEVTEPEPGDIVYWSRGHVGIVVDPEAGTFLNAQSKKSGLGQSTYKDGWWKGQSGRKFLRYAE